MTNDYATLAVSLLWSHYRHEEREHLSLERMHSQARFLEASLREARQVIEAHLVLWTDSRPKEAEGIPRERELLLELWTVAARGKVSP